MEDDGGYRGTREKIAQSDCNEASFRFGCPLSLFSGPPEPSDHRKHLPKGTAKMITDLNGFMSGPTLCNN